MKNRSLLAAILLLAACGSKSEGSEAATAAPAASEPAASEPASSDAADAAASAAAPAEAVTDSLVLASNNSAAPATSDKPLAAPSHWTVDKGATQIEFTGSQTGKEFTGRFSSFDIEIVFDPDNLGASHIKATIDTASASTGDRQRDDALPSADWFASSTYPAAVFESTDIRASGGGYEANGKLTIRGLSKDIALPFTLDIRGDKATADGSLSLLRTDFGVGQGEFSTGEWVGLDVKIAIHVEATR